MARSGTNYGCANYVQPALARHALYLPISARARSQLLRASAQRGPGYFNTDLNLKKSFALTERVKLTLAANFFHVLNHPNFDNPVSNNLSSSFGHITTAAVSPTTPYGAFASAAEGMRIVQVFGKINF